MVAILQLAVLSGNNQSGNNKDSEHPSISANGRYIAFSSAASNLTEGDTNEKNDIFVYDRDTNTVERVSIGSGLAQSNGHSSAPSISDDGRFITFLSAANNLVAGDTNQYSDIFVYDRNARQVKRISVNSDGAQSNGVSYPPSISGDGRYVTFQSAASNLVEGDTNNESDIFVYDLNTSKIERISVDSSGAQGNSVSSNPYISANGRYVTFSSFANNLVDGDTNDRSDIFVYDRDANEISRVSLGLDGVEGNSSSINPQLSANGRYVTFSSKATNLVASNLNEASDVFVYDRETGITERASVSNSGQEGNLGASTPSISADGRFVVYTSEASNLAEGDTNGESDIFVYDRITKKTKRVSLDSVGKESR